METAASAPNRSPLLAFGPLVAGLVSAGIGFGIGVLAVALVGSVLNRPSFEFEVSFTFGYVFALTGWLMGVGMWGRWAREWFGMPIKSEPTNWHRYLTFCRDHKVIGIQYMVTMLLLFLLGGLFAMIMRWHLMDANGGVLSNDAYNRIMSLHGIIMIAVAVATILGGFGNYFVPIMIGARDMAFPRLNALSYWMLPPVAVLLLLAQAYGGWDSGWTAYAPLSVQNASGQLLFNLAIITFGLSSIFGGLNFLVTIIYMRAPGMTWGRMPIFVWSAFAAAMIALTFTQLFAAALFMVTLDRLADTSFFRTANGGTPLLYQHVFWFYSHPAVYIFVLPGFGLTLEIIASFSRKPLFAYKWVVGALLGIVGLSGIVWAHHMFVSGMSSELLAPFLITTELISIPTGFIFLAAIGTLYRGKVWLRVPMLFALGTLFNFAIGGTTGIFLADVPTDINLSDTYFVVAHFHYTIIGGEIFAIFAAFYHWFPKITGKQYSERLGQIHFWMMFIAFNVTFMTMFWPGVNGMNRRVATYASDLQSVNVFVSIAAFLLGSSFIFFLINLGKSLASGPKAATDPWKLRTLEWRTSSPPSHENFPAIPVVSGGPYDYGVPNAAPHAMIPVMGGSGIEPTTQSEGV